MLVIRPIQCRLFSLSWLTFYLLYFVPLLLLLWTLCVGPLETPSQEVRDNLRLFLHCSIPRTFRFNENWSAKKLTIPRSKINLLWTNGLSYGSCCPCWEYLASNFSNIAEKFVFNSAGSGLPSSTSTANN